jgi:hypothetical protein
MKIDQEQFARLLDMVTSTLPDDLGCDGCYELMDQLAQCELDGSGLSQSLALVQAHISQCKCCRDEYDALLTALRAMKS